MTGLSSQVANHRLNANYEGAPFRTQPAFGSGESSSPLGEIMTSDGIMARVVG